MATLNNSDIPEKGDKNYWDHMKKAGVEGFRKSKKGRPKKIATPEILWQHACDYFKSVDEKPFKREDFIRGGESAGSKVYLNHMRPYTWAGFTEYVVKHGIISALDDYKYNAGGAYEDFRDVVALIDKVMYAQKFEGAASGFFNSSIIMRDLKLNDELGIPTDSEITFVIKEKK